MPDMMPLSAISVMEEEAQWLSGTSVNFTEAAKAVVENMVTARAMLIDPARNRFFSILKIPHMDTKIRQFSPFYHEYRPDARYIAGL